MSIVQWLVGEAWSSALVECFTICNQEATGRDRMRGRGMARLGA